MGKKKNRGTLQKIRNIKEAIKNDWNPKKSVGGRKEN